MSIRKNTALNFAGSLFPIILGIITVPTLLKVIGDVRYGIISVAMVILGYFSLFDLGLSKAVSYKIASINRLESSKYEEIFWTVLVVNCILGIIGFFVLWPLSSVIFKRIVNIPDSYYIEAISSGIFLALSLPVAMVSGMLVGTLLGIEKFFTINIINILGTLISQIFPLICAIWISNKLSWLLGSMVISRIVFSVILFIMCLYHLRIKKFAFNRHLIPPLFKYGGWITISSIIGPILASFDRIVIGAKIGISNVTYYAIPSDLFRRGTIFATSISTALFPRYAAIKDNNKEKNVLTDIAMRNTAIVLTPIFIIAIFITYPLLSIWISKEFAIKSSNIGHISALAVWVNSLAHIPLVKMQGEGRPNLVAKIHAIELIPYGILLYILINRFGLIGVAVAWLLRVIFDLILLIIINNSLNMLKYIAPLFILVSLATIISSLISYYSAWRWICDLFVMVICVFYCWRVLGENEKIFILKHSLNKK